MYRPAAFRVRDVRLMHDLVERHPFGMLVAAHAGGVEIAHVPFLLDRRSGPFGRLRLHVSRANPVAAIAASGAPLTAVFRGPDTYVSASWYERPAEEVPTWNYAVVHAQGRAGGEMPRDELRRLLADLAAVHEAGSRDPWRLEAVDPALLDEMLAQIAGFSIDVEALTGKFKLSQNRSPADRARVRGALAARGRPGDAELAAWMG